MPTVSIILPTFNGVQTIPAAVSSVLSQTYTDWELLVITDGSMDDTHSVINAFIQKDRRIFLIENKENLGIQKTLNKGIMLAKGKYIARIDDDDRWVDATKLAKQVSYLETHADCVLVGTSARIYTDAGVILGEYVLPLSDNAIRSRILFKNCFLHPTVLLRKSAVDYVGGYDESETVRHIEDYALWLRLGQIGMFANLPDLSTEIVVRESSLTFKNRIFQVKRLRKLIRLYKNVYPHFYWAAMVLWVRLAGFTFIRYVPIPRKMLYQIQRIYKKI